MKGLIVPIRVIMLVEVSSLQQSIWQCRFRFLFPLLMTPVVLFAIVQVSCAACPGHRFRHLSGGSNALIPGLRPEKIQFTLFEILPQLQISFRVDLSFSLAALHGLAAVFIYPLITWPGHAGSRYYPALILLWAAARASLWPATFHPVHLSS